MTLHTSRDHQWNLHVIFSFVQDMLFHCHILYKMCENKNATQVVIEMMKMTWFLLTVIDTLQLAVELSEQGRLT